MFLQASTFLLNLLPGLPHLDPYPFQLLSVVTGLEAIFLSTFILISQNHDTKLSEKRNHLDLQINLLSEQENTKMLELLEKIATKLQVNLSGDPTVAVLKEATRPDTLLAQIDDSVNAAEEKAASA